MVTVYSITEFMWCHAKGIKPEPIYRQLKNLSVVGDSSEGWIESWNSK
jgi:hypothetical protein